MPTMCPVTVSDTASAARAIPKSVTFTCPASVTSRFPGLTSRCTMPIVWAASMPSEAWAIRSAASSGASGSPVSMAESGRPSTSSITRNGCSAPWGPSSSP